MTEAINGMKATDEPTRAKEMRESGKNDESHAMPKTANAIIPFQNWETERGGAYHSSAQSKTSAATEIPPSSKRKLHLSRCADLFSVILCRGKLRTPSVHSMRETEMGGTPHHR